MVLGRPIPPLTLNLNERETLTNWAHRLSCPQSLALGRAVATVIALLHIFCRY